jgi:hypothetical protein
MLRGTSQATRALLCNLAVIALALTCTACGGWAALSCRIPSGPAHVDETDVLGTWRGPDGARFILLPGGRLRFEQMPPGDWSAFGAGTPDPSGTGEWSFSEDGSGASVQRWTVQLRTEGVLSEPDDEPFLLELFTAGEDELELDYFRGDEDQCDVQRFRR